LGEVFEQAVNALDEALRRRGADRA